MEHWNESVCVERFSKFCYLANRSQTLVKVKRGLKFKPERLFQRLQAVGFPFRYIDGLDVIHFTIIPGTSVGYYQDGKIWIDVSRHGIDELLDSFLHEVGHFLDDEEELSPGLGEERKRCHRFLSDKNAGSGDDEYLAIGFERFYAEQKSKKQRLRQHNPKLYRTIQRLHRQFKSR